MIKDVLSSIGGVGGYGVISVLLFFTVFVGVILWACGLKKPHLEAMSRLPLEEPPSTGSDGGGTSKEHPGYE
jgi:hypothetical protein